MCNSSFKESVDGFIKLPEVEVTTFEDFMLWLHCYIPSQTIQKTFSAVLDLAIFADIYQILPLHNQTSDIILQLLLDDRSLVTPEIVSRIYESTPDGSVLRRHVSLAFCTLHEPACQHSYSTTTSESSSDWEAVFDTYLNFGRDYFINTRNSPKSKFQNKDFCSFHDHSNMIDWVREDKGAPCPYQEGDWFENEVTMDKLREVERLRQEEKLRKKEARALARREKRERMTRNILDAAAVPVEDAPQPADVPDDDAAW